MSLVLLALALAAPAPSAEALTLGRRLAEMGSLAALLPAIKEKETQELIAEAKELTAAEQAKLRSTADRVFQAGHERLMIATGEAYAGQLSIEDLRALVAFHSTPAAARYREATPGVIAQSMTAVGKLDFKGDVRAAFCAEAKRLCPTD